MKQYSIRARQSADSICGVDEAWLKNDSNRITIPKDTIAAGYRHTVGLKSDGTVTVVGDNKYGQCDVRGWRDIVAVAAGNAHTGNTHIIGLKSDGTVVAVGDNEHGQCDVSSWRGIQLHGK